jgi:phage terminase large subunit-like protein
MGTTALVHRVWCALVRQGQRAPTMTAALLFTPSLGLSRVVEMVNEDTRL